MKQKSEEILPSGQEEHDSGSFEFQLQKARIKKILETTIYKLRTRLSIVLADDGKILREYLNKTEADFVTMVCNEHYFRSGTSIQEQRVDLDLIFNMLDRINLYEKRMSGAGRRRSSIGAENYDMNVAYAVDVIFKCKPLVDYMESIEEEVDPLLSNFIGSVIQLESIMADRLSISAVEEVQREHDLKTAYRLGMMLSNNIQELEDILEKQRQELGKEQDRKETILIDLEEKIVKLREKCQNEIDKIIYESEVSMMKDYNKSVERQEEYAKDAAKATREYESLLDSHLETERVLRAKRLKVEAQLATWIAKYDTDIGDKQAEYDELEKQFQHEKEEMELLQQQFDEQEEEYVRLMKEKAEEERRIFEEKLWIFLQNRSARIIQRAWREHKERKRLKKLAKKAKKKGGHKKGKSPKDKKKKEEGLTPEADPGAALKDAFSDAVVGDLQNEDKAAFEEKDVEVNLHE